MKNIFLTFALFLTGVVLADQIATTSDGKKVILHDDKTWEYKPAISTSASVVDDALVPSTNDDAVKEWEELRTNHASEIGKIVVWNVRIWENTLALDTYGGPEADLYDTQMGEDATHQVILLGKKTSKFLKDDVVCVKGQFAGVNKDGDILLKVLNYKITGVVTGM